MDSMVAADAAVDYRGNPADRSKTGGWLAAGLILGTELAERICVVGISTNLVTYLVGDLNLSASYSANVVTNFMGTLNLLALVGGFAADAMLGRFLTAAISVTVAAAGTILLTMATSVNRWQPPPCEEFRQGELECVAASGGQLAILFAALYIIAAGAGGIKATVSGFATDQFDENDPKEEREMLFFFNRFYFGISLGSLFAVTVLIYIEDEVGRSLAYGIAAAALAGAVIVLLSGTRRYRFRRPQGSSLTVVALVMWRAWRNRGLPHPAQDDELNGYETATVPHTDRLRFLDKAAIVRCDENSFPVEPEKYEKSATSTITEVEEVKMVVKLLPIWATSILFWTIYSQMTTFSVEQAMIMNREVGPATYPSGSMPLFLFISILLITSFNQKVLVPLARRITHNDQGITSLQRIGVGLLFSVASMAAAALVEKRRRDLANDDGTIMSVFWLVPQYCLVGIGEGFVYVGHLEFFIREAPERMKSMSTGLFISSISMGFFLSSVFVTAVEAATNGGWIETNLNRGRLDYFYWMLAVLGVLNYVVFWGVGRKHQYKQHGFDQDEDDDSKNLGLI